MDITTGFNHILNDWNTISNRVNDVIRYNLHINGHGIALSYTKVNGLGNQLSITWFTPANHTITLFFDIKKIDDGYQISTYIPNEYFSKVKYSFNFNEEKPVNSFMSIIFERILTASPVTYNYDQYRQECRAMHFQNSTDNPFFQCFRRQNISPDMQDKVWRKYTNAGEIIAFCKKYKYTLQFTADISLAKDFSTEFNNIKLKIQNQQAGGRSLV